MKISAGKRPFRLKTKLREVEWTCADPQFAANASPQLSGIDPLQRYQFSELFNSAGESLNFPSGFQLHGYRPVVYTEKHRKRARRKKARIKKNER